jgi:hypothetical protein
MLWAITGNSKPSGLWNRPSFYTAAVGRAFPFRAVTVSLISPMEEGLQALPTLEAPHDSDGTVYRCPAAENPFTRIGLPFVNHFTGPLAAFQGGHFVVRARRPIAGERWVT